MQAMVTRCPKCSTAFKITEKQLATAKGAVRCGSCLHIFNAKDYLVHNKPQPEPISIAPKTTKPAAAQEQPSFSFDQQAINDEYERSRHDESMAQQEANTQDWSDLDDDLDDALAEEGFDLELDDDDLTLDDDDDLLIYDDADIDFDDDEPDEKPAARKATPRRPAMPGENNEQRTEDDANFFFDDLNPELENLGNDKQERKNFEEDLESKDDADESWAKAMLDEMEKEDQDRHEKELFAPDAPKNRYDEILVDETTAATSVTQNDQDDELAPEFIEAFARLDNQYENTQTKASHASTQTSYTADLDAPIRADRSDRSRHYDDDHNEKSQFLKNIQPAPVEMDWINVSRRWPKTLMWWTLCLLAGAALAAQVAWIKFDHWSRIDPYRSYYSLACNLLDCQLPARIDTSKIKVSNLVIRSHPQVQNALTVDAILLNHAQFAQPFPDLVISFSDLNGKTVAARRFTPDEYLAGELAGRSKIPYNQPVHLSMDIADPGRQAVNYQAYIPTNTPSL